MILYLIVAVVLAVGGTLPAVRHSDGRGDAVARVVTMLVMCAVWPITVVCVVVIAATLPLLERR